MIGISDVLRLIRPLKVALANSIARAVVELVDDGKKQQLLQLAVLEGEVVDDAENFQPYGHGSVPHVGAEAVALFPSGDRGHSMVVVVADRRHRPTGGQAGEVFMYTDEGDQIRLGRGHIISLSTTGEIRLGSTSASIAPALATEMRDLKDAIAAWAPVPGDGGASLKAIFSAWLVPGATKVRVE